jgi:MoaA/NifB/PqqE/SkfB family radical SAM enzyme
MKAKTVKILDSIAFVCLTPPKTVTRTITNSCNLSCSHCLPDRLFYGTLSPVPVDTIKKLIREFTLLGVKEICLTGGEPLTHPDWFEILSFACRRQDLNRVCLQTNGCGLAKSHQGLNK